MSIPFDFLKNKWFRTGLLALFCIVALTLFFGSRILYANPFFQAWVKTQITIDTGGDFQFQNIKGGFVTAHLEDLSLNLKNTPFNVQSVQRSVMHASFAWIPLLKNKLVIHSLTMEGGRLDIRLNGGSFEKIALPVSRSFELKKGTIAISNFSGWTLELNECDLDVSQTGHAPDLVIAGKVFAQSAVLGGLALEKVKGEFRMEKGRFSVRDLSAVLPGNSSIKCTGSYALDDKPALDLELSVDSSDIKGLLGAVDFSNRFAGKARVTLKATGQFTPKLHSLDGKGEASFSDIVPEVPLPKLPAYNDAPVLKRVRDINDLGGRADFQLSQNKILVTQLDLKNKEIHLTGTAQIGYDRSLSSQLLFTGSKAVDSEIPALARNAFTHDKDGNVLIPFQLKPNTRNPEVDLGDLMSRVISGQVKGFNPFNLLK